MLDPEAYDLIQKKRAIERGTRSLGFSRRKAVKLVSPGVIGQFQAALKKWTPMYLDKSIRAGDIGLDQVLIEAARRAELSGDMAAMQLVADQFGALADAALKSGDRAARARILELGARLKRAIAHPESAPTIMHTKGLAAPARDSSEWQAEIHQVKAAAALGEISGYGSVFNVVDLGGDVIKPGAFADSLREQKADGRLPVMLASHDSRSFPIGVWTNMAEDSYGLRVVGKVAATPRGQEAWDLIHMTPSALDGLSIGFMIPIGGSAYGRNGVHEISKIDLFELSLVSMPMNPLARLDSPNGKSAPSGIRKRSDTPDALDRMLAELKRSIASDTSVIDSPSITRSGNVEDRLIAALKELSELAD
jgi:HK97 family phage prohead protease